MRCWHPRAVDVIKKVREYNPEEVILLPLYPQYSASTSGSSIKEWNDLCNKENYKVKTKTICCYPTENNFIESHTNLIKKTINSVGLDHKHTPLRTVKSFSVFVMIAHKITRCPYITTTSEDIANISNKSFITY